MSSPYLRGSLPSHSNDQPGELANEPDVAIALEWLGAVHVSRVNRAEAAWRLTKAGYNHQQIGRRMGCTAKKVRCYLSEPRPTMATGQEAAA